MDRATAVRMINDLVQAEVQVVKEVNRRSNGPTKTTLRAEENAVKALFLALTGEKPTTREVTRITEF